MAQDHYLAKAIADSVWSKLILVTASKAEKAGIVVEMADAKYTSQRRPDRGTLVPKDLLERIHDCPFCGLKTDRGHNAVRNILAFVLRGSACRGPTPALKRSKQAGSMK
jgi:putative transposase